MFIFDFVAETVLDQIIDWLYGKIIGFLNDSVSYTHLTLPTNSRV